MQRQLDDDSGIFVCTDCFLGDLPRFDLVELSPNTAFVGSTEYAVVKEVDYFRFYKRENLPNFDTAFSNPVLSVPEFYGLQIAITAFSIFFIGRSDGIFFVETKQINENLSNI